MQEELISFQTAVKAKEIGYKEPCKNWYNFGGLLIRDFSTPQTPSDRPYPSYSAPTQSLLQKWIRENHKIEVLVYCNASGWMWELNKTNGTNIMFSEELGPNESGQWDTYEHALDVGLFVAAVEIKNNK